MRQQNKRLTGSPSEAQKGVWHKESFHSFAQPVPTFRLPPPLKDPRHTLTTQPLTSSHPQPTAPTASVFHYSALQLPCTILQQLLRQHEQGAKLSFCLFNIQPREYRLRRKSWMKCSFSDSSSTNLKVRTSKDIFTIISSLKFLTCKKGHLPRLNSQLLACYRICLLETA